MKIKKIFNNNVILLADEHQNEIIVMGKGIGFNKHNAEFVDFSKVDKKFVLDKGNTDKLAGLVSEIPVEHLELSHEIIEYAKRNLSAKLSDNIYITLTDHISFALVRLEEGLQIKNVLLWEIKKFYKEEFRIALGALDLIEQKLGIRLPEDEAGSIALHFVNAQHTGQDMRNTVIVTRIVNDLANIVKYHYGIKIDEESLNYSRFMTHLKYFAYRMLQNELIPEEQDSLYDQVKEKYPEAYVCTQKLVNYLERNYNKKLTNEEMFYLVIHIQRLTSREI
ncbi:BglG family transcription antiterminator LicT [Paenibacillus macerans]|uniref:BglG family transcription antiterminator LicT n=1 Tax=Paenibacillus macerans TaxID=44252 RepID=UPI0020418370|nr:PRD domain-containing protein [Paenibacillus macerans]MCM3699679.1 PRD domain-containing protein [Paenibacillus macerans]